MKIIFAIMFLSVTSFAKPLFLAFLKSNFPQAMQLQCLSCHSSGMNSFGRDFKRLVVNSNYSKEGFAQLMELDSDGDGVKNYTEILQGRQPGISGK